jgi:hypothetical protein
MNDRTCECPRLDALIHFDSRLNGEQQYRQGQRQAALGIGDEKDFYRIARNAVTTTQSSLLCSQGGNLARLHLSLLLAPCLAIHLTRPIYPRDRCCLRYCCSSKKIYWIERVLITRDGRISIAGMLLRLQRLLQWQHRADPFSKTLWMEAARKAIPTLRLLPSYYSSRLF